ncbi:MAG: PHP domain-containing protein [Angelakisella sp.]
MAWLDMHLHSCYSDDGEYTPRELMSICLKEGVRTAAIADHNTTQGVAEATKQAAAMGITLIPGIELDCVFRKVNLHLLGYWIDDTFDGFAQVEKMILEQEQKAAAKRLELVEALGIYIHAADIGRLSKQGVVTGEMIAEAALGNPQNDQNPLLLPYRSGGTRSDNPYLNFYWDYCAQGKPAYVPIHYISLPEAVALVRKAGGVPVLAHPGNNIGEDVELLSAILQQGVDGIEVFSSYHSPEQTDFYLKMAEEFGVAASCGSDFHGKTKPNIRVGCVDCRKLEEELLSRLMDKRR